MRFNIITTGKGTLKSGVVVGDIEASTHDNAARSLLKFLGGRPLIWELRLVVSDKTNDKQSH